MDSTMLTAFGYIATRLSTAQWYKNSQRINHFLDYADIHSDAKLTYYKSDMHIYVHAAAYYLAEPKLKTQFG